MVVCIGEEREKKKIDIFPLVLSERKKNITPPVIKKKKSDIQLESYLNIIEWIDNFSFLFFPILFSTIAAYVIYRYKKKMRTGMIKMPASLFIFFFCFPLRFFFFLLSHVAIVCKWILALRP